MPVKCPHCQNTVGTSELRSVPESGGGLECPSCKGMVRFVQPHAAFRRSVALLLSCLALMAFGVRNPLLFIGGSVLLWIPMSMAVNMYCLYVLPLSLKQWKQRGRKPFDSISYELFRNRPK